ncbi:radical SAM protein [Chryseobacterium sp. FH2]|uniref:grasp-with-spasm system SPASM domain peptide maturase n=1 Tax=Chryseobacterium sp. FH2 TaxID=1674291 RepID=UPI00065AF983|nr:grasp-with-spasm system SPASM domain peptide maturase [Chryseobacterium sp. FH2]KMQ68002.1 radical SAM protein [Chryseobacterium sp. FH2]
MNYFNLFSNILVTKGIQRVLVTDLQRDNSELYPLEFNDIFFELSKKSIEDVINSYDFESQEFVKEYIDILLQKEYGFISINDWDKNFPSLSYDFSSPNNITNAYLEIENIIILNQINKSLSNLGTEHVVIYYNKILNAEEMKFIEETFKNSTVTSIEIFSRYHETHNESFFATIDRFCSRIYHLVFFSCPKSPFGYEDKYKFALSFIKEEIQINSCGKVDLKYFNTNLPKVLEAVNHNSCLHKKIAIDKDGNIRNCPAMPQSFGNIKNTTLEQALQHADFKKYWNLTKDEIEVCKDCEFRYICTDCRAYTERTHSNENGLDISKPLKCGYDPYTGEWEEWSTNPLKQKAIQYYEKKDNR